MKKHTVLYIRKKILKLWTLFERVKRKLFSSPMSSSSGQQPNLKSPVFMLKKIKDREILNDPHQWSDNGRASVLIDTSFNLNANKPPQRLQ